MRTLIAFAILAGLCGMQPAAAAPAARSSDARIGQAQAAAAAQERVLGDVIDVELDDAEDDEPGGEVYEIKLLTPAGDVVSVRISALNGQYLGAEGPDLSRALRPLPARKPSP